jgi:hypothetical protein
MTTDSKISARQLEAFKRFQRLLPHGQGHDLVIMKGHLLLEEQLRQLIDERVKNPQALKKPRIDYTYCISLAQAFFPDGHDPALWESLKKLNELRNALAHQMEPKNVEMKMSEITSRLQRGEQFDADPDLNFEFTLWSLFTAVADLVERPSAQVLQLLPGGKE